MDRGDGAGLRRWVGVALVALATLGTSTSTSHALDLVAPGLEERTLGEGFFLPTDAAWAPDGRMVVTEKGGTVKLVPEGSTTPRPLLDLSAEVLDQSDRGLLGVAIDPEPMAGGDLRLYLLYVHDRLGTDANQRTTSRLVRYRLTPDDRAVAPEVVVGSFVGSGCAPDPVRDCLPSEGDSHSIGTVAVAPDGTLFLGSGDASAHQFADPQALQTYDETSLRGKIIHVDRQGRGVAGHPFCPQETDLSRTCTKLFAKGFRNPFRFNLRPDGGVVVGDVGWNTLEEVSLVPAGGGGNFGWPCREGTYDPPEYAALAGCQVQREKVEPAWAYCHLGHRFCPEGNSVVGGPEVAGERWPAEWRGTFFVGDYAAGWIKRLQVDAAGKKVAVHPVATGWLGGVSLRMTPWGTLAHVELGDFDTIPGRVRELAPAQPNRAPTARATATPANGPAPLDVQLDATGSSDPDDDPLTYAWDLGDGATATGARPTHRYAAGRHVATVTVSDGRRSGTASVTIDAGGTPPVPAIDAPGDRSTFRLGGPVALRGSATDADGDAVTLRWRVLLHHDSSAPHVHPAGDLTGPSASFEPLGDHGAEGWYEIVLTARDATGLEASRRIRIDPELRRVRVRTDPDGAPITLGSRTSTEPVDVQEAVGLQTALAVPAERTLDGRTLRFAGWSDGVTTASRSFTVPDTDVALVARYAAPPANRAPVVTLTGGGYRNDRDVTRTATATDPDGDPVTATWTVRRGAADGPLVAEGAGLRPVFTPDPTGTAADRYVLRVEARDPDGATAAATASVFPQLTAFRVASDPAGVPVAGGGEHREPIGRRIRLVAPDRFEGRAFTQWSDGATAAEREVVVPEAGLDLTARYVASDRTPLVAVDTGGGLFRNGVRREVPVSAQDPDGDELTVTWEVVRAQGGAVVASGTGLTPAFTAAPEGSASESFLVRVLARDPGGNEARAETRLWPELAAFEVVSDPEGVDLRGGGSRREPIGRVVLVGAPDVDGLRFDGWSDGGAAAHEVTVPGAGLRLVARYAAAGNRPPVVELGAARWRAGAPTTLTGRASDPDGGAPALAWTVRQGADVVAQGTGTQPAFTVPDTASAAVSYVVRLEATDTGGATAAAERTVYAELAPVRVVSEPAGAVLVGGGDRREPIGRRLVVEAALLVDGRPFAGWSDDGARRHEVVVAPEGLDLTARYGTATTASRTTATRLMAKRSTCLARASALEGTTRKLKARTRCGPLKAITRAQARARAAVERRRAQSLRSTRTAR